MAEADQKKAKPKQKIPHFGDLKIDWLQTFVQTADTGKGMAAAEVLKVNQPVISRRIQRLELWLHETLFDSSSGRYVITPAGEKFLPIAKSWLSQIERYRSPSLDQLKAVDISVPESRD